jgi:asparagine synthase (glutamine-hydrolysing)
LCGIAGFNWNDQETALKMAETLRHRGPDQSGYYCDRSVTLGHSRLSIIDLSDRGKQPMSNEDGNLWIVHNGEIYNFLDLRRELESKHVFVSGTDTEVILHAYEEWGTEAFKRFNGMWAFCIYDKKAQILVLSRDRIGEKPLYYFHGGGRFIFASELKAIVLHHSVERKISKEAVDLYFSLGYIPSPWSIYEGISKLEPRQQILYDLRNHELKKDYYYEIPRYAPLHDRKRLVDEGRDILKEATRLRLIADVPVGAFLSGGLDSSSVVATMTKDMNPGDLHTFSIGFEGRYDETRYMEIVKNAFKTRHHHKYFTERDFELNFEALSYFYDEPFADSASSPTYELSRLARERVTVSLSGDGGDEIFGGYRMHQRAARFASIKKIPVILRKLIYKSIERAPGGPWIGKLKQKLRVSLTPQEDFYTEFDGDNLYKPEIYRKWSAQKMRELLQKADGNLVQAVCLYDLYFHTLPDCYLVKVDRASMAHALEVRCPFLDCRFLELMARIPARWKANGRRTKILMREIIKDIVPAEVAQRRKQGFTPPVREWIEKEKYRTMIQEAIEGMSEAGVPDKAWHNFFVTEVMKNNDAVFHIMRLRILVFWQWWQKWMDRPTKKKGSL